MPCLIFLSTLEAPSKSAVGCSEFTAYAFDRTQQIACPPSTEMNANIPRYQEDKKELPPHSPSLQMQALLPLVDFATSEGRFNFFW